MSNKKFDKLIAECFDKVKKEDKDLPHDIHETTFVFRFGHYLANCLEKENDYKVDMEYNRNISDIKRRNNKIIRLDLIVHKRGKKENNLIAMEFKKNNDSQKDRKKLESLKNDCFYLYQNVYFIIINKLQIEKFENNKWIKIGDIYE